MPAPHRSHTLAVLAAMAFLTGCASTYKKDLYAQGKKFARVQVVRGLIKGEVIGYDSRGGQVYRSHFIGGCDHKPNRGKEVMGTREEWDLNGQRVSSWVISPDSARAVYTRKVNGAMGAFGLQSYVYNHGKLDTILDINAAYDTTSITTFQGAGCMELGPSFYIMFPTKAPASLFNIAYQAPESIIETFHDKSRTVSTRTVESPDSMVQISYFESGKVQSRWDCGKKKDKPEPYCTGGLKSEWLEDGRLSVEQKRVNERLTVHRHFYPDGKPMTESFYQGTKLDSVYTSWHENGQVNQKITYALGKELDVKEWDQTGKLIKGK